MKKVEERYRARLIRYADDFVVLCQGNTERVLKGIKTVLRVTKTHFRTEAERMFVEDLIVYLDYKIREGKRIRNERKQLSFW